MSNTLAPESDVRESLLAEVADEFRQRLSRGEQPDIEEYVQRYPQFVDVLRQLLPVLAILRLPSSESAGANTQLACLEPAMGCLGDYQLVCEIGRGGMGVVYEAVQTSLDRRVALKVLPFAAAMDAKQLQRFQNEAQAAAHLQHTNIVPVYAVGCERGVHFYAMQLIEGQTLAAVIRELRQLTGLEAARPAPAAEASSALASKLASGQWAPVKQRSGEMGRSCGGEQPTGPYLTTSLPHDSTTSPPHDPTPPVAALSTQRSTKSAGFFRSVGHLGVQAAEALEHAHQQGIIHRDIKPANLLVDGGARLWITDFGLAHCQSQAGLTMSGDLVGTLRYMSPEQALAKRVLIDQRTDIYSLGVTLYELLTLEPAFSGRDREELLRQITFEEPRPPRRLNKSIPAELETIVLKAIEKNPAERYATAQELADDLRRYLEDKPIRAKQPTLLQRAVKWSRRHQSAMRAAAVVLILAMVGLAASTGLIWLEKEQTKTALADAKTNAEQAQRNLETAYQILDRIVDTAAKRPAKELTSEDRQLMETARTYYEQIADEHSDDPSVRLRTAEAYQRVARIQGRLGQSKQAAAAYQQALNVAAQLAAEYPDRPEYRHMLARTYSNLGGQWGMLIPAERLPELYEGYAKAVRLLEELVHEDPTNLDYQHDLGVAYFHIGYGRLFHLGRPFAEAEEPVYRAVQIRAKLVEEKPSVLLYWQELGMSLGNYGNLLTETGRFQEAEKIVAWEREVRQKAVDDFPVEPESVAWLADAYMDLAKLRGSTGKWQEAVKALREEVKFRKKYAAEFPWPDIHLAGANKRLGDALLKTGARDEAIAAYEEAIAVYKEITHHRTDQATAFADWGQCLACAGARAEAVAAWLQAALETDNVEVANRVAWFLATTPEVRLQNPEKAIQLAKKAVSLAPQNGSYWSTLGAAYYRAGQWQDALAVLEKAMALRSGGDSADWFFLAMAQRQLGDAKKARHWYDQAVQWMDKNKPYDEELRRLRAEATTLLGIQEEALHK